MAYNTWFKMFSVSIGLFFGSLSLIAGLRDNDLIAGILGALCLGVTSVAIITDIQEARGKR